MVDIKDYYHVTLLYQMHHWFQSLEEILRVDIESTLAPDKNLQLLLLADKWVPIAIETLLPTFKSYMLAWRALQTILQQSKHNVAVKISIFILKFLIPHLKQPHWSCHTLCWVTELCNKGKLKGFIKLDKKYYLPKIKTLQLFSICQYLISTPFHPILIHL